MSQSIFHLSEEISYNVFSYFTRHSDQAITIVDLKVPKILYINPAGRELWDLPELYQSDGAVALDKLVEMIHQDDRNDTVEKVTNYLMGKEANSMEFRIRSKEVYRWLCVTFYSIEDKEKGKSQLLLFGEDITGKKEYELYLLSHNSKKNAILNILSHDLRGPLSNIFLISEMQKEQFENESFEEAHKLSEMIERTCSEALALIDQYLNKELLESSDVEVKKIRIEMIGRVSTIFELLKASHTQLNRTFTLESSPADEIWMEIDDVKLLQVINNLLSNAMKFTPDGGAISVHLKEEKDTLLITVKDDGIGIPEEYHPFIFDEFTKAKRKGLRGEKPIGLGLSITKKLVELQGGKIWFESGEGKGTAFYVRIPK